MHDIENELAGQQKAILSLINEKKYEKAIDLLWFASPLWHKAGYTAKIDEYYHRIKDELTNYVSGSLHWKVRQQYENLLKKLIS